MVEISMAYNLYKHPNYKHLKLRNKSNKVAIADYKHFIDFYKTLKYSHWDTQWKYKKINKAVFRGWDGNGRGIRKNLLHILDDISFFNQSISLKYFDVKSTPWFGLLTRGPNRLSIVDQIKYRYIIVMDGVTVRDSMIYQMLYGSVVLKQLSTMYEYFYWDLVNNYHLITWETILDLISIVINLVDTMNVYLKLDDGFRMNHSWSNGTFNDEFEYLYTQKLTYYNNEKLEKITENAKRFIRENLRDNDVDCYMIHLLQIWNEYILMSTH